MKIALVTYFFHPVINPRAFRAFELVKEICKEGHELDLYVPDLNFDYSELEKEYPGLKVNTVKPGFFLNKKERILASGKSEGKDAGDKVIIVDKQPSLLRRLKTGMVKLFYPGGFNFEYTFTCGRVLRKSGVKYDKLISVALPLCSHSAVWWASRGFKRIADVSIADYGDPYSFNRSISPPVLHRLLERRILRKFNYVLVPTDRMIKSFLSFKSGEKILVIPQALDFGQFETATSLYSENNGVLHMTFAGNFYDEIRNPEELFEFLTQYNEDFRLILFVNTSDPVNSGIINKYKDKLKNKIVIHNFLPRVECVTELSKSDFNINIQNTTEEQTPSKLIDYVLADRPIFSYKPGEFNEAAFKRFLAGDYTNDARQTVDKSSFDIKQAIKKIMKLS